MPIEEAVPEGDARAPGGPRGIAPGGEAIAVVGPGRMGIGIATAVLMAGRGLRVTLVDTKVREKDGGPRALSRAKSEVDANLKLLGDLGLLDAEPEELLRHLDLQLSLPAALPGRALVFEALPEIVEVKQAFYRAAVRHIDPRAVIASATSTFQLDSFSEACGRSGNVVCAHWLNPAFLIPLVEVAYGPQTPAWAVDGVCGFFKAIGKIPVAMRSSPGFIVPRIQAAAMNEAVRILSEGVATAAEIDTAIKAGFGFRLAVMGLIEFVDLGGVDILFHAGRYLKAKLGGAHFEPPPLVAEKMARGEVGPRSGRGFYDYDGVEVRRLFDARYRGFAELLKTFARSDVLNFAGGVAAGRPRASGDTEENRKEAT
jgi:3-hydroxybutyryl-CoA dehydrogenase